MLLDRFSYTSPLGQVHPMEKSFFAIFTMIICILANSIIISSLVLGLMAGSTILGGKVPLRFYLRLLLIPVTFLALGTISIAVTTITPTDNVICSWYLLGYPLGITPANLQASFVILAKSLGAVSCLLFLVLTTPMLDIIYLLRMLRIPELFLELMLLIYRFLFVLWDSGQKIYLAQSARLGYSSGKKSLLAMGMLMAGLLLQSLRRSRELTLALEARGYHGALQVLARDYTHSPRNMAIICLIEILLLLAASKGRSIL